MADIEAKQFSAELSLDEVNKTVVIPQTVVVEVDLTYPVGYSPDREVMIDRLLRPQGVESAPPFALVDVHDEKAEVDGVIKEKIAYRLEPLFPGSFGLTLFEVPFISVSPEKPSAEAISGIVFITSVLPEKTDFKVHIAPLLDLSLKEPIALAPEIHERLVQDGTGIFRHYFRDKGFPLQVFGVLLAIVLMTVWLNKMSKRIIPIGTKVSDKDAALLQAERHLSILQKERFDRKTVESFVEGLTKGVRFHLEEKLRIPVLTRTSEEFLASLKDVKLEQKMLIQQFLSSTDRIKFQNRQPSLEECLEAQETAKLIMREI